MGTATSLRDRADDAKAGETGMRPVSTVRAPIRTASSTAYRHRRRSPGQRGRVMRYAGSSQGTPAVAFPCEHQAARFWQCCYSTARFRPRPQHRVDTRRAHAGRGGGFSLRRHRDRNGHVATVDRHAHNRGETMLAPLLSARGSRLAARVAQTSRSSPESVSWNALPECPLGRWAL